MKQPLKSKNIAFRLTDDEYAQIESAAIATGVNPNDWCRSLALAQSDEGHGLTSNERLIYEELARVRYLVGHGFRLLAERQMTPDMWAKLTAQAEQKAAQIAEALLSRRRKGAAS